MACYEAWTLQSLAVSGVRHVSVSVFDTNTTPVLRSIFWTLQVSTCPCPYPCRCFILACANILYKTHTIWFTVKYEHKLLQWHFVSCDGFKSSLAPPFKHFMLDWTKWAKICPYATFLYAIRHWAMNIIISVRSLQ